MRRTEDLRCTVGEKGINAHAVSSQVEVEDLWGVHDKQGGPAERVDTQVLSAQVEEMTSNTHTLIQEYAGNSAINTQLVVRRSVH